MEDPTVEFVISARR